MDQAESRYPPFQISSLKKFDSADHAQRTDPPYKYIFAFVLCIYISIIKHVKKIVVILLSYIVIYGLAGDCK